MICKHCQDKDKTLSRLTETVAENIKLRELLSEKSQRLSEEIAITDRLKEINQNLQAENEKLKEEKRKLSTQRCGDCDNPLFYYCYECNKVLCTECACFSKYGVPFCEKHLDEEMQF